MRERAAMFGGTLEAGPPRGARLRGPGRAALRGGAAIRVLIADDQPLMRAGFRTVLEATGSIAVVAEAGRRRGGDRAPPSATGPTSS